MSEMETLSGIRFVLCRPSHPGNVGAAARAMKTMGITDLRLVGNARHREPGALAFAANSTDILAAARVHATLGEALGDCVAAFAFSARAREWAPQLLDLREAAGEAVKRAAQGAVAFVFGNETAGLTNEEMFCCQLLVRIPTGDALRSLNLAQAVQVAAYELRMATFAGKRAPVVGNDLPATVEGLEGLYRQFEEAALACGFYDPQDPKRLRERVRRLFSRASLEREEVNILRGLLRALTRGRVEKS